MEAVSVCRGLAHLSTKLHSCLDKVYRLDLHTYECVLFNEYILICVLSIIYGVKLESMFLCMFIPRRLQTFQKALQTHMGCTMASSSVVGCCCLPSY